LNKAVQQTLNGVIKEPFFYLFAFRCKETCHSGSQGDQIGQFFAHWAIVNLGQFFLIREVAHMFDEPFPAEKVVH
jgi:hypothetical protein